MHDTEGAVLPLSWIPAQGNDIPPLAVPLKGTPNEQLYIARGLVEGEMHIGTTSHSSSTGARLKDKCGRAHVVYDYEVLTCASNVRFKLESPSTSPVIETTGTTPRPRLEIPPPKTPGRLTPFAWLSPRGQPAEMPPKEPQGRKYQHDPPPYSSPKGGWIEAPKRPRPIALTPKENVQFKHLVQSKCFALIDDTPSMQYSWAQTRAALAGIIDILSSDGKWEGLDVRFLQHVVISRCIETSEEFEHIFNSVPTWRGEKVMTEKVSQVFAESLPLICETATPKPVVLLIITDGTARDTQELLDALIGMCQKLNAKRIPPHMFRVHLLQMGDDRKAVKPLHDFRDRITQRDRERRILNVVSYHRGRGLLNGQNIIKLLLASTSIPVEEDPDIGERKAPEEIEAQYREVENIRTLGRT